MGWLSDRRRRKEAEKESEYNRRVAKYSPHVRRLAEDEYLRENFFDCTLTCKYCKYTAKLRIRKGNTPQEEVAGKRCPGCDNIDSF